MNMLSLLRMSSKSILLSLFMWHSKERKEDFSPGSLSGCPRISLSYLIIMGTAAPYTDDMSSRCYYSSAKSFCFSIFEHFSVFF